MSVLDDFIMSDMVCDAMGYNDDMTDIDCLAEQGWFDHDRSLFADVDDEDN